MTTYVDSSALVAVYITERFSDAARSSVRAAGPVPFTPFHRLEVSNAFELLVGRGQITRRECRAVQAQLHGDVEDHRLVSLPLDLDQVFADACDLSRVHAARRLARSLDLLHVAAALAVQCTSFVSADDRQLAVAKASGLKAIDIKRGSVPKARGHD